MPVRRHKVKLVLIVLFVVVSLGYWDDPWLWRKYVQFFSSGSPDQVEVLEPLEQINGDGSYVLPVAEPEDVVLSSAALDAVHAYAEEFGSHALIIVHKGVIQDEWYAPYWQASDLTQSQSMHKSLMGLLVGVAIEDGVFESADDPVGRYIGEWANDARGDITLRNLMRMSSGLAQYDFTLNPFADDLKWLNSGRSIEPILRLQLADWPQGTRWNYNDINAELLGIALARAYDMPYPEILRQKLWLPMGGDTATVFTDRPDGRSYTSCCLGAPAMDWARVGMMFLNRGEVNGKRIVAAEWIDEMVAPSPVAGFYGYQIWLGYQDPILPAEFEGASGTECARSAGPFIARDTYMTCGRGQQHIYVVPSADLMILRMGPALGGKPIKDGYDNSYLVNVVVGDLQADGR